MNINIKQNIKPIISVIVLLISIALFAYALYLFYLVTFENSNMQENIIISTNKEVNFSNDIVDKMQENKDTNSSLELKLRNMSNPF